MGLATAFGSGQPHRGEITAQVHLPIDSGSYRGEAAIHAVRGNSLALLLCVAVQTIEFFEEFVPFPSRGFEVEDQVFHI